MSGCPNCGARLVDHNCPHLIPHCPGRCPLTGAPGNMQDILRAQVLDEQVYLWTDLADAVNHALVEPPVVPGHWSGRCDNIAARIMTNARLVGAVDWVHIPVTLVLGGIYEKVLHTADLTWPPIDWDEARALHDRNHAGADDATWTGPAVNLIDVYPDWKPL